MKSHDNAITLNSEVNKKQKNAIDFSNAENNGNDGNKSKQTRVKSKSTLSSKLKVYRYIEHNKVNTFDDD